MKKKSVRLRPVEKLAEDKAKTATLDMVSARTAHKDHESKLRQLMGYRFEYIEQFQTRAKNGMKSAQLQQYQQFISQLNVAIVQQEIIVKQAGLVLDQRQTHWRHKDSRKRALNKVVRRFQKQEVQADENAEQAELDELNTQQHNQKNRHV